MYSITCSGSLRRYHGFKTPSSAKQWATKTFQPSSDSKIYVLDENGNQIFVRQGYSRKWVKCE